MKRKIQPLVLLLMLAVVATFTLVSCTKGDDVIKNPPTTNEPLPVPHPPK